MREPNASDDSVSMNKQTRLFAEYGYNTTITQPGDVFVPSIIHPTSHVEKRLYRAYWSTVLNCGSFDFKRSINLRK